MQLLPQLSGGGGGGGAANEWCAHDGKQQHKLPKFLCDITYCQRQSLEYI